MTWIAAQRGLRPDGHLDGPVWVAHCDGRLSDVRWGDAPVGAPAPPAGTLSPGLVDLQCNGGVGIDLGSTPPSSWGPWRRSLAAAGVTAVAPTIITGPFDRLIAQIADAHRQGSNGQSSDRRSEGSSATSAQARLLGVHLEGPFIAPSRLGAHPSRYRLDPTPDHADALAGLAPRALGIVTLAPELPGADDMIVALRRAGVTVSIGHSDATAEQVHRAADLGASMVTHLGNAQRGLHQREPGVVGAALVDDRLTLGLIGDLVHVHADLIELARRAAPDRCVLVTDAVAAAGVADRAPRVAADRGDAAGRSTADDPSVLAGGIHSGSMVVAGLVGAGFDPGWVLDAFTRQPARTIGRTDLGTLEVGARADLVRWTPNWTVDSVWIDGDRFVADPA